MTEDDIPVEGRAALSKRWFVQAANQLDGLLQEARVVTRGNAADVVDFDRLMAQITEADKLLNLQGRTLPRSYQVAKSSGSNGGIYLKKHGSKVKPEQFAADLASGWLMEFNGYIDRLLEPKRPPKIEAMTTEEAAGGTTNGG